MKHRIVFTLLGMCFSFGLAWLQGFNFDTRGQRAADVLLMTVIVCALAYMWGTVADSINKRKD